MSENNNKATDIRLVPQNRLSVDHDYQRKLDPQWMNTLVRNWRPELAGVFLVSSREDGELVVLDGQHRLAAVRELLARHDERAQESVWCEVYFGLSQSQEADIFMGRNARRSVHMIDRFRARVVAGEPTAKSIVEILHRNNVAVDYSAKNGYACVSTLERLLQWGVLESAIFSIENSWPVDNTASAAREMAKRSRQVVEGMGIFQRSFADSELYDLAYAIRKFSERMNIQRAVENARNEMRAVNVSQSVALARMFRDAYNYNAKRRLPEITVPRGMKG